MEGKHSFGIKHCGILCGAGDSRPNTVRDLHVDLRPNEQAVAFLDDTCILAPPHRVLQLYPLQRP